MTPKKLSTEIYLIKHASWNSWIVCLSFSKWPPGIWTGGSSAVNIKPRPRDFGKTELFIWIAGNIEMMISQTPVGLESEQWSMRLCCKHKAQTQRLLESELFIWIDGNIEMMISQNSCGIGKWTMINETPKSRFPLTWRDLIDVLTMTNIVCRYLTFYTVTDSYFLHCIVREGKSIEVGGKTTGLHLGTDRPSPILNIQPTFLGIYVQFFIKM